MVAFTREQHTDTAQHAPNLGVEAEAVQALAKHKPDARPQLLWVQPVRVPLLKGDQPLPLHQLERLVRGTSGRGGQCRVAAKARECQKLVLALSATRHNARDALP